MNELYNIMVAPFLDYVFMRRAILACIATSIAGAPLGVFLVLRRMTLMGEALSHGVLPGLAAAFLIWGLWLPGLTIGGLIAGLIVALISNVVSRNTRLREDATLGSFYILALAGGVFILSLKGGQMHVMHILFGSILAVDQSSLVFIASVSTITLIVLAIIYRPFVYDCFDPFFTRSVGICGQFYSSVFLIMVVCNLIAACQALGTLMALGIMIIPAVTAYLLVNRLSNIILTSIAFAFICSYGGLLLSYHCNWPSGPTVILLCGCVYLLCLVFSMVREWIWSR